jgi:hypothetical protein
MPDIERYVGFSLPIICSAFAGHWLQFPLVSRDVDFSIRKSLELCWDRRGCSQRLLDSLTATVTFERHAGAAVPTVALPKPSRPALLRHPGGW